MLSSNAASGGRAAGRGGQPEKAEHGHLQLVAAHGTGVVQQREEISLPTPPARSTGTRGAPDAALPSVSMFRSITCRTVWYWTWLGARPVDVIDDLAQSSWMKYG
jgi:hypothetical protein